LEIVVASSRGDELIDLLSGGELGPAAADAAANELLRCVFHGYPVENMRRLVRSDSAAAAQSGAWVISELGAEASPVLDEIEFLLGHPARNARFFAVSATLAAASISDGALLAKAISLISDCDEAVRWQALRLLSGLQSDLLGAAAADISDASLRQLVTWLSEYGDDPVSIPVILRRLEDPDKLTRLVASAASARLASRDRRAIDVAANSDDQEIRTFARRELSTNLSVRSGGHPGEPAGPRA
jgi:hypothetical protein